MEECIWKDSYDPLTVDCHCMVSGCWCFWPLVGPGWCRANSAVVRGTEGGNTHSSSVPSLHCHRRARLRQDNHHQVHRRPVDCHEQTPGHLRPHRYPCTIPPPPSPGHLTCRAHTLPSPPPRLIVVLLFDVPFCGCVLSNMAFYHAACMEPLMECRACLTEPVMGHVARKYQTVHRQKLVLLQPYIVSSLLSHTLSSVHLLP